MSQHLASLKFFRVANPASLWSFISYPVFSTVSVFQTNFKSRRGRHFLEALPSDQQQSQGIIRAATLISDIVCSISFG